MNSCLLMALHTPPSLLRHLWSVLCRGSDWEVLDYIDVVVHIFTEKQRAFYDLDGYYGMAEVATPWQALPVLCKQ